MTIRWKNCKDCAIRIAIFSLGADLSAGYSTFRLIISIILGVNKGLLAIGQSIFPVMLRAYGYVSSYVFLMILSPFMNIIIKKLKDNQLYCFSFVLVVINFLFPSFLPFGGWGEHYTFLFISLYFVAASIQRMNSKRANTSSIYRGGVLLWAVSAMAMIGSPYIIKTLSSKITFLVGREDYLFNYHNIVVLLEAVGFFVYITNKQNQICEANPKMSRVITRLSECSLIVYLYHMHPIFKRQYSGWPIFEQLYSNNPVIYLITVIGLSTVIYAIGFVLNAVLSRLVSVIVDFICKKVANTTKLKSALYDFGIRT